MIYGSDWIVHGQTFVFLSPLAHPFTIHKKHDTLHPKYDNEILLILQGSKNSKQEFLKLNWNEEEKMDGTKTYFESDGNFVLKDLQWWNRGVDKRSW